jgi:hemolysin activation/secretion protein
MSKVIEKMKNMPDIKPRLASLLLVLVVLPAVAADNNLPDAGLILQQMQPYTPAQPSATDSGLIIEQQDASKLPVGESFLVNKIEIIGNENIDTRTLHKLVANSEAQRLNLKQLQVLATRIGNFYRTQGYPLTQAIIPSQSIQDGVVRIEVIEARFGKISLSNSSRVNETLLQATLSALKIGMPIMQKPMDRSLLLLSDIPGVIVNATLRPGASSKSSDLEVETTAGPMLSGNVAVENHGSRYTGRSRIGATVNLINLLGFGDVLSVSALSSGGGVNYANIAYEGLLNQYGSRLGASYSALHYVLGEPLQALQAHGTAQVQSLWLKQPLLRSQNANLYGQVQYDSKQLRDRIDVSALRSDRSLENWTLRLSGDMRDKVLAGGINIWSIGYTAGEVSFDNAAAHLADAENAKTNGSYSKWNVNFVRLQKLSQDIGIFLSITGQRASKNLDSVEKVIAGGARTVRGYDIGAISGDNGVLTTLELRQDLGTLMQGQWQAVAFVDNAHITINKNVWTTGANSATLSGAGIGLNWASANLWSASAYIATPIGSTPAMLESTASNRAWFEIGKRF